MTPLLLAAALSLPAEAEDTTASVSADRSWNAYGGFPWTGLQYSRSLQGPAHWVTHFETALFLRWDASSGVGFQWSPTSALQLNASVSAGWIEQYGPLPRQGPQANAVLRVQRSGRVVPRLEHKSTAFWAWSTSQPDYQGLEERIGLLTPLRSHTWELGLGIPVLGKVLIEPSIRFGSVDEKFALPAVSIGARSLL